MVKINKELFNAASNSAGSRGGKKEVMSQEEERHLEDKKNCFTYL